MIAGEREKSKFGEIWDKIGGTVMGAVGVVPVVGGILPLIESGISMINDTYQNLKFDLKVQKINSIITTNSILEKDLSLAIASSAIKIATIKGVEIATQEEAKAQDRASGNKDAIVKAKEKFQSKLDDLLTKAGKTSKTELTPASKMAIEDVILFINHIATNDNAIKLNPQGQDLDKEIAKVFTNNIGSLGTNNALTQAIALNQGQAGQVAQSKTKGDCIVGAAYQFTYDNELLNHPELLKFAIQDLGSKAIDLSTKLSPDLVGEAAYEQERAKDGYELLLAGLMSLPDSPNDNITL